MIFQNVSNRATPKWLAGIHWALWGLHLWLWGSHLIPRSTPFRKSFWAAAWDKTGDFPPFMESKSSSHHWKQKSRGLVSNLPSKWTLLLVKKPSNATNVTLRLAMQAIWRDIWNACIVTLRLFRQVIWEDIWKLTQDHTNHTNATNANMHLFQQTI